MRGKVLTFNEIEGHGLISGDDGQRYEFVRAGLANGMPSIQPGTDVDFQINGTMADAIYVVASPNVFAGDKNKVVAALLAFFLGSFGIHKFYLGKTRAGVIMLLCGTVGWILLAIPPLVVWIIGVIEFVIYLTKTDQQFYRDYVVGDREWF